MASVITGSLPHIHGVGADRVHDPVLRTPRSRCREDFLRTPVWDVLSRHGVKSAVFGTPLAGAWPGRRPPDVRGMDVPLDAVEVILGNRVAEALTGPPGVNRTEACRVRELLARTAFTHEQVIAHLRSDGGTGLTLVGYQETGELFRAQLVDLVRLSDFIGQMVVALRDTLPVDARLVVCTMPTESQNACVSHAAPAGRVARGVVVISPAPDRIECERIALEDVFGSVLATWGLPHAVDLGVPDALGIGGDRLHDPLFTHSDERPIDLTAKRHPDAQYIPGLDSPQADLPGDDYPGRSVLRRIDAGIRAVSAVNAGDTRSAHAAAVDSEGEPRLVATDAFFAFTAASRRDSDELAVRLKHLSEALGETPLTAAGRVLAKALSGDHNFAQSELARLVDGLSELPSESERDAARRLLALTAELAGLIDEAEDIWGNLRHRQVAEPAARLGLARCALARSRWSVAVTHARAGRASDPRSIEGIRLEIQALEGAELFDEAATLAMWLLAIDPARVESRKSAARLLRAAGRDAEALRVSIGDDTDLPTRSPDQASSL